MKHDRGKLLQMRVARLTRELGELKEAWDYLSALPAQDVARLVPLSREIESIETELEAATRALELHRKTGAHPRGTRTGQLMLLSQILGQNPFIGLV